MSDQSTRAGEPQADPRQPFTLGQEDAQALYAAAQQGEDATNGWWLNAGQRLGFVWTTVGDLHWKATPRDDMGETQAEDVQGATFTAWPEVTEWQPDPDAVAWLNDMVTVGDADSLKNRELILRAFAAGSDHGFAMGVATRPQVGLGWDGMELIRSSAELFREYEAHHRAQADSLDRQRIRAACEATPGPSLEAIADRIAKADRNDRMAEELELFLADPTQSHLVHDGLREARDDNATAALAGWHAAMLQVRELVESGAAQAGSGIPPLVLLDRLGELPPPEDMDEVFQRLRDPMAQVERLRFALREWLDKSEWVREAVKIGVPKSLGMPPQWGRHYMDTARDMVGHLNKLLAQAIAGTLAGLRVQAAADVLQAMGITKGELHRNPLEPEETRGGLFPGDPGYKDAFRDPGAAGEAVNPSGAVRTRPSGDDYGAEMAPALHGGPCTDRAPFVAWCSAGFADGDIVEVREKDGHCHPMKVGSPQFVNALRELGERMPVRAATDEQRKGWEA